MEKSKEIKHIKTFLRSKGYEILDEQFENRYKDLDIIVRDPKLDTTIFILTKHEYLDEYVPEHIKTETERAKIEQAMMLYMTEHETVDGTVRVDEVTLLIPDRNTERALLRHHLNVFGPVHS